MKEISQQEKEKPLWTISVRMYVYTWIAEWKGKELWRPEERRRESEKNKQKMKRLIATKTDVIICSSKAYLLIEWSQVRYKTKQSKEHNNDIIPIGIMFY